MTNVESLPQLRYYQNMVRNDQMPQLGGTTKIIAETIAALADSENLSDTQLAQIVGKSRSYAQVRRSGHKAWNTEEIDRLAKHFGFPNAFGLLDMARGMEKK